jgi:hypothetical protein
MLGDVFKQDPSLEWSQTTPASHTHDSVYDD